MSERDELIREFGLSADASHKDIVRAMAEYAFAHMRSLSSQSEATSSPRLSDPQEQFHELARRTSEVLGISLSDSYSLVSAEAPTLYQRAADKARLN
jgi:hypothetical protein